VTNLNLSLFLKTVCVLCLINTNAKTLEEEINLEDNVSFLTGFLGTGFLDIAPIQGPRHGPGINYGLGGYGDPLHANFSTLVCPLDAVDTWCTPGNPDENMLFWRFIENIGWRKFTPYGAARKDWWEFKAILGYPFFNSF
jgi:hypothetical protein